MLKNLGRLVQVNAICSSLLSHVKSIQAAVRIADKKEYNNSVFPPSPKSAKRYPI